MNSNDESGIVFEITDCPLCDLPKKQGENACPCGKKYLCNDHFDMTLNTCSECLAAENPCTLCHSRESVDTCPSCGKRVCNSSSCRSTCPACKKLICMKCISSDGKSCKLCPVIIKCPSCGEEVDKDWKVCPGCTGKLKNVCESCGKELKPNWKACPASGDFIKEEDDTLNSLSFEDIINEITGKINCFETNNFNFDNILSHFLESISHTEIGLPFFLKVIVHTGPYRVYLDIPITKSVYESKMIGRMFGRGARIVTNELIRFYANSSNNKEKQYALDIINQLNKNNIKSCVINLNPEYS